MCLKSLGGNLLTSGPKMSIGKNNKGLSYFPFVPPPLDQLEKKWLLNSTKPHTSFFFSMNHILASKDIKWYVWMVFHYLPDSDVTLHLSIFSWSFRHTARYRESFLPGFFAVRCPILSISPSPGALAFVSWCFFSPCVLNEGFEEQMHCHHN